MTATITTIEIRQSRCEWGEPVTSEQDAALTERYVTAAQSALATAYPDAEISLRVDRQASGGRTSIRVEAEADEGGEEHEDVRDEVRELLGRAWQETCEGAADILDTGDRLIALRVARPSAWQSAVRAALSTSGSVAGAAEALDVSVATLHGWVRDVPALTEGLTLRGRGRPVTPRTVRQLGVMCGAETVERGGHVDADGSPTTGAEEWFRTALGHAPTAAEAREFADAYRETVLAGQEK